MHQIKILTQPSDSQPFVVVYKPSGLPTAPLNEDDRNNALFQVMEFFPQVKDVKGRKTVEYGLVHRLDTLTEGIFLVALNQDFYDFIQMEQKQGRFLKEYRACCDIIPENCSLLEGFPVCPGFAGNEFSVHSFFRSFGKDSLSVRPVTENSGKAALKKIGKSKKYTTSIFIDSRNEDSCFVHAVITEGFRHQVRCHLAWCGIPVKGDPLYNSKVSGNVESHLEFSAVGLEFNLPDGKKFKFSY